MARSAVTAGIVLAGGSATRMGGGDKTLLSIGGKTMLSQILGRLEPQIAKIAISANGDLQRFATYGRPVLSDDEVSTLAGPLAGILSGMRWATGLAGCDKLLTVAGDTPFLPDDLAFRLASAASGHPHRIAVAASAGRRHPVVALWPVALASHLDRFLTGRSNLSVAGFLDGYDTVTVDFPLLTTGKGDIDPFFNINSPDDLSRAEALIRMID